MKHTHISPVDLIGTTLLTAILLSIVILFTCYGNGQWIANLVLR